MKIEELVESIQRPTTHYADQDFYAGDIEGIIKEYAEWYANKCLLLASQLPPEVPITSFQLPKHD